ncbi:hypothetical protein LOC100680396 [Anopheles sinensis]|uniref:Uncharacterized protein n=1 Tax=Anopheles sinensis TaxID=74873 RepID=A0A084VVE6_ANOSI|nr:hypothetical protein LOC100680396 [Anopheles sinensis]
MDGVTSTAFQTSTISTENALGKEVLPTEALAILRVPRHQHRTTTSTTTESIPMFNRTKVNLVLPPGVLPFVIKQIFTVYPPSCYLVLRSWVRFALVLRFYQPLFGNHLTIKIPKQLPSELTGKCGP